MQEMLDWLPRRLEGEGRGSHQGSGESFCATFHASLLWLPRPSPWWLRAEMYSHRSERWKSETTESAGLSFLQSPWGEPIPGLFQLLVAARVPWLVATLFQPLPLWFQDFLLSEGFLLFLRGHCDGTWTHQIIQDNLLISKSLH